MIKDLKKDNDYETKWNVLIDVLLGKFNKSQDTIYLDIILIMKEIDKVVEE